MIEPSKKNSLRNLDSEKKNKNIYNNKEVRYRSAGGTAECLLHRPTL